MLCIGNVGSREGRDDPSRDPVLRDLWLGKMPRSREGSMRKAFMAEGKDFVGRRKSSVAGKESGESQTGKTPDCEQGPNSWDREL